MLVPTLALGSVIARKYSLNAVTLDGDQVDRRGALTGGFIDNKKSRLASVHAHRHWRSKLDEQQLLLSKVRDQLLQAEQAVTRATADIQKHSGNHADVAEFLDTRRRELTSASEILQAKLRSLEAVEASLKQTRQESELLRAELGTSFRDTDHGARLKELTQEIENSKTALAECNHGLSRTSTELAELQSMILHFTLHRRVGTKIEEAEEGIVDWCHQGFTIFVAIQPRST